MLVITLEIYVRCVNVNRSAQITKKYIYILQNMSGCTLSSTLTVEWVGQWHHTLAIGLFSSATCKFCPLDLVSLFFSRSFGERRKNRKTWCAVWNYQVHWQRLRTITWWRRNLPKQHHTDYADDIHDERYSSNSPGKHCTAMLHRTYHKKW